MAWIAGYFDGTSYIKGHDDGKAPAAKVIPFKPKVEPQSRTPEPVKHFKVWVKTVGSDEMSTNGLVFDTEENARAWGEGLLMRWTGSEGFEVRPTDEGPVNHTTVYLTPEQRAVEPEKAPEVEQPTEEERLAAEVARLSAIVSDLMVKMEALV